MITYELALELSNAGFKGIEIIGQTYKPSSCPTLSELIEACNPELSDDFGFCLCGEKYKSWFIYFGYFTGFPKKYYDDDGFASVDIEASGSTIYECIAKLWLKLKV